MVLIDDGVYKMIGSGKWKRRYGNVKEKLLLDENICQENKDLFGEFFRYQEYKLQRTNGISELDESTYKTLYGYIMRMKNVNKWFENKPLKDITEVDIKRVYDDLEDGKIKTSLGKPVLDRKDYYDKVFKSKLFEMVGKKELSQKVIQFTNKRVPDVRFITEDNFKILIENAYKPRHKLLFWLAWDIGENVNSLLKLRKKDFYKEINKDTGDVEYRVNLRKEILKRSRRSRSEITNYSETVKYIEMILKDIENDDDRLFEFEYRNAYKVFDSIIDRTSVTCMPNNERPSLKDLRSGMTCDLLAKGWTRDELNARLGHSPSSNEIDRYINFLAIDRRVVKKKVSEFQVNRLTEELEESKTKERLLSKRVEEMKDNMDDIQKLVIKMMAEQKRNKK